MARPKPFFIIGGYFKALPSNRVGNSVKEHLIFAVNRVIATGSLSLKQIRKSSTVLILLPPITRGASQHLSVNTNHISSFSAFLSSVEVMDPTTKSKMTIVRYQSAFEQVFLPHDNFRSVEKKN